MGISNKMDKIILRNIVLYRLIKIICLILFLTSCSSIEMVYIKNNTNEDIKFQGQFTNKNNIDNMIFSLKPGGSNLWRYEIGYFNKNTLDKGLKKIILKSGTKCEITLERNMIDKIAIKNGMWEINIDENIMICK